MTVVVAQTANAFACRSSTRRSDQIGWTTNRLLMPAAAIELAFSLVVLLIGPIASHLEHADPPAIGWLTAVAAAVLVVDAIWKARRQKAPVKEPLGPMGRTDGAHKMVA